MIHSFIFSDGKLAGRDLELDALRLVRADKGLYLWIDLDHPTDGEIRDVLEGIFKFHPLAIEDCVTPSSLPKVEDYDDHLFLVTHAVDFIRGGDLDVSELNLFFGKDFLVTFHRSPLRPVQAVMDRCAKSTGGFARGTDRLAHLVLDAVIDNYKPVTDELRIELEDIEETVLDPDEDNLTERLLEVRSKINLLRQIVRPQREMIHRLAHGESKLIRTVMLPYFRDLRDNLVRVEETATTFSDQLLISFDLYLSKSDFKANEGIKVLTALTALSLPATIIGTWYGMNFARMPELDAPFAYPVVFAVTVVLTYLVYRWCKRRRLI